MRKKSGKYIVYINQEYFEKLCAQRGIAGNNVEKQKFFNSISENISSFLKGDQKAPFISSIFTNDKGQCIKGIEASPLLSSDSPKTLHYIRKINQRRKR